MTFHRKGLLKKFQNVILEWIAVCDLFDFSVPPPDSCKIQRWVRLRDHSLWSWDSNSDRAQLACPPVFSDCAPRLAPELMPHCCDEWPILFLSCRVWNSVTSLPENAVLANSAGGVCFYQNLMHRSRTLISSSKLEPIQGFLISSR